MFNVISRLFEIALDRSDNAVHAPLVPFIYQSPCCSLRIPSSQPIYSHHPTIPLQGGTSETNSKLYNSLSLSLLRRARIPASAKKTTGRACYPHHSFTRKSHAQTTSSTPQPTLKRLGCLARHSETCQALEGILENCGLICYSFQLQEELL